MGNYGSSSIVGENTYANPFIMIDYSDNNNEINLNNRFACDLGNDPNENTITTKPKQKVKNYTLAAMLKQMIINYDGSKDHTTNTYISSPSGINFPGGKYLDAKGEPMKVYTAMACCKGAVGTDAIGGSDNNAPKKSVSIPIAMVVRPNEDNSMPIFMDVINYTDTNKFYGCDMSGNKKFYFYSNYKDKINALTSKQLDTIIQQCAHGSMCLKSNIVGLQIKANPAIICGEYIPYGQTSDTNQDASATATCHTVMKHICAKQLYDQGCINMRTDSNGQKKPSWINSPKCTSYNLNTDTTGNNFFTGTPDCACINSMSGYSLNNKPKQPFNDNPYQLTPSIDNKYYNDNGDTPYALNVWNSNPTTPSTENNNNNYNPGLDDPNCVTSMKLGYGAYMLPKYYITLGNVCSNINVDYINADEFKSYNINHVNICGQKVNDISASRAASQNKVNSENAVIQASKNTASQNTFNSEQAIIQASQNTFNSEQAIIQASRTASQNIINSENAVIQASRTASQNTFNLEQASKNTASQTTFNSEQAIIQDSQNNFNIQQTNIKVLQYKASREKALLEKASQDNAANLAQNKTQESQNKISNMTIIIIIGVVVFVIIILLIIYFIYRRKNESF